MNAPDTSSENVAVMLSHALRSPQVGESEGAEIGLYTLVEKLGDGGFGSVWRAEQSEPVEREVALKIIKLGMDTLEVMSRFEQERVALSMMDHPNIAKVLDAGATPEGRPFFVMELVRGVPLTTYCIEKQMPLEQRLLLFKDVCAGVQHAHQKGIIHRDLKPSNILVAEVDGLPVPKIIDFGIAKAVSGEKLIDATLRTRAEQMIGTPLYMSPEQADGSADIDTRSDVYALGALLYEMLTGRPPFDAETLLGAGYEEMRRIIREVEPVGPSKRQKGLKGPKGRSPTEFLPSSLSFVSFDLDLITLRALAKDRARRYESVTAFADDVQRFLNHEPVTARAPSLFYVMQRWARRHRAATAAMLVSVLAIGVGASVAVWQAVRATHAQQETARQLADAEGISKVINDTLLGFVEYGKEPTVKRTELAEKLLKALRDFKGDPLRKALLLSRLSDVGPPRDAALIKQQAITLAEKVMAPNDRRLWTMREEHALALCSWDSTRDEGLVYLKRCVDHSNAVARPDDDARLHMLYSYGFHLDLANRSAEALPFLEEAHRLYLLHTNVYRTGDIVFADHCLALTLLHLGRGADALVISRANIARVKTKSDVLTIEAGRAWLTHAIVCKSMKLIEEAASAGRSALDLYWTTSGPAYDRSTEAFDFLIALEKERANIDAVLQLHRDAVRIYDTKRGAGDVNTAAAVRACAAAMLAGQKLDDAESFTQDWLQRVRLTDGTIPEPSLDVLNARIDVLMAGKRKADALPLLKESLAAAQKTSAVSARNQRVTAVKKLIAQINGWPTLADLLSEKDIAKAFATAKENLRLTEEGKAPEGFMLDEALANAETFATKNNDTILAHEYQLRRYELARAPDSPLHDKVEDRLRAAEASCLMVEHLDEAFALHREFMAQWKPAAKDKASQIPRAVTNFVWELTRSKHFDEAESVLSEWEPQQRAEDGSWKDSAEYLLYFRCENYYRKGDAAREEAVAKDLIEVRTRRYPTSAFTGDAHRFMAHALMKQGRYADAMPHIEKAMDLIGGNYVKSSYTGADKAMAELRAMRDEARNHLAAEDRGNSR